MRRRRRMGYGAESIFCFAALFICAASATAVGESSEEGSIVLNRQAELLLHDDRLLEQRTGLELVPMQLRKHPANPLLGIDRPWEKRGILNYVALLHDEEAGLFRMYYQILGRTEEGVNRSHCLYAESRDGIRWEKPNLGLVYFEGSRDNNIVVVKGAPEVRIQHVLLDPDGSPERRYKGMIGPRDRHPVISADGYVFTKLDVPLLPSQDESQLN